MQNFESRSVEGKSCKREQAITWRLLSGKISGILWLSGQNHRARAVESEINKCVVMIENRKIFVLRIKLVKTPFGVLVLVPLNTSETTVYIFLPPHWLIHRTYRIASFKKVWPDPTWVYGPASPTEFITRSVSWHSQLLIVSELTQSNFHSWRSSQTPAPLQTTSLRPATGDGGQAKTKLCIPMDLSTYAK